MNHIIPANPGPPPDVEALWRGVLTTLKQQGLLLPRPQQGGYLVPEGVQPLVLPDRVVFVLDLQRLGNIPRERWVEPALAAHIRATLGGYPVVVTNSAGLAVQIARSLAPAAAPAPRSPLPRRVLLTPEHLADAPYTVCLGYAETGPVYLDLAGTHRAILTGGTSGGGKTTFLLSAAVQLVAKHSPEELRLAILDPKQVDFGGLSAAPQLFAPLAHDLTAGEQLITRVAGELYHRMAVFQRAGATRWERYNATAADPVPLIVLIVDEVADFAKTAVMATLIEIARKGRAFGVSVLAGTQHPTREVIDSQVKANLPTGVAFRTRSGSDSRVILDVNGAEHLRVPGRCLAQLDTGLVEVQTLYVDPEDLSPVLGAVGARTGSALVAGLGAGVTTAEIAGALLRLAQTEFSGEFNINALYEHPWNVLSDAPRRYRISKRRLTTLAQVWEKRGWLTVQTDAASSRLLTETVLELLPQAAEGEAAVLR